MTSSAPLPDAVRIAVFAKAPVAGHVKTRLAGFLGAAEAAALHAALVRHALARALEAGVGLVELHGTSPPDHPFFAGCAADFGVRLVPQRGADLGERMRNAFADAFSGGHALIVIGADCPAMGAEALRAARDALRRHDAVITPAEDGGYVLIGLASPVDGLFADVEWGSSAVLGQTRARLARAGVRCVELPALWDVDLPEDYARLEREGLLAEVLR